MSKPRAVDRIVRAAKAVTETVEATTKAASDAVKATNKAAEAVADAARIAGRVLPKRRVRLDNDARRAQLLALARTTFSDRSYDEVSIDDLAKEAKISKGLLYHYFPTKRDLYVAGLSQIAGELVTAVTSAPAKTDAPADRVRAGLEAYLVFITQHARAFVSLMRGGIGSDPEVANVVEGVRTALYETFVTESPFAATIAKDPRMQTTIRGWIGAVEATSIDWTAHAGGPNRLTREQLRELLVEILFASIRVVVPALV
ncbi:MAG TPA: TetR/AcrR family transcriptional regulator [Kofleriaceae bacterium]